MNKKLFLGMFVAAGMLFTTSCSNDELDAIQSGNEAQVTFSLGLEDGIGSRAISDGKTADKLIYAVYNSAGEPLAVFDGGTASRQEETIGDITSNPHPVTITLAKGQSYKVAFWAQNSKCGAYETSDLRNVTVSYKGYNNDDNRDAFFKTVDLTVSGNKTIDVVLKRPFAQINVGVYQTDWDKAIASGVQIQNSEVEIKNAATNINLLTGVVDGEADITYQLSAIPNEPLKVDTDKDGNKEEYKWLSMSYILVNETSQEDVDKDGTLGDAKTTLESLKFTFDPASGEDIIFAEGLNSVPVQRNWRTNILGKILTGDIQFNITIDPVYDGDYIYPDGAAQELEFAATFGGTVTLTEDLTLTAPLNVGADMILNIEEGKTLTGSINVAKGANLTVNEGTINNTDENTSGIVSNGDLTLNDVKITSARHALRIESGNVVINGGTYKVVPTSKKTLHALNVGDDGTTANVTIKGGTFIGPKGTIADSGSAVSVKEGSTVTIEGGDFSGGKNNTLSVKGTVTISGGTFDQDPTDYVANGYKTSKSGDKWYVIAKELGEVATDADALVAALENGKDVILYNSIKIDPANMSNAYGKTGINIKNGQTIDGNNYILDIKGAGGTWDSGINTTGGLIKNITVTGSFRGIFINHNSTYSEPVVLDNVTIDGTTYTISCDQGMNQNLIATNSTFKGWTSYAATLGTAQFTDCYFGEGNGYAYCRPYAPTEFVGCEFEAGYQMDARTAVTFENCTLNGVALTADNLATLVTSNIENATVK